MEMKAKPVLHRKISVRKYHKRLIFLLMTALMLSVMLGFIRKIYLVFVPVCGTDLLRPLEFPEG